MMNYIEEAQYSILLSDQQFYEELLEQLEVERDFMLACIENNIILEADGNSNEKKGNWLNTIIDTIKRIFNKFLENVKNLFKTNEKWIEDNIGKLPNLNFDGLSVNVLPYWDSEYKDIINALKELQKEIDVNVTDKQVARNNSVDDILSVDPFKKYVNKDGNFNDGIKSYFMTGNKNSNELKPVKLEGDQLKKIVISKMVPFVNGFESTILPSLELQYNSYTSILNRLNNNIKRNTKTVGESFCLIENALYCDTELRHCLNSNILFEADNDNQTNNQNNDNKPTPNTNDNKEDLNKVVDTNKDNSQNNKSGDNDNVKGNDDYYQYTKKVVQMNQYAVTAAMTALNERYNRYMQILKQIVAARDTNA